MGGLYDERQASRLREGLGVRLDQKTWVTGASTKILERLPSAIRKADLVLCFIRSSGHGYFYTARELANSRGIPCVVCVNLNPEQVAQVFLRHGSNMPRTPSQLQGTEKVARLA